MGMMPHPERAADDLLGSSDGKVILSSMVNALIAPAQAAQVAVPTLAAHPHE